jgi:hypothetical protein
MAAAVAGVAAVVAAVAAPSPAWLLPSLPVRRRYGLYRRLPSPAWPLPPPVASVGRRHRERIGGEKRRGLGMAAAESREEA